MKTIPRKKQGARRLLEREKQLGSDPNFCWDLTPIFEELLSSPSAYKPEGKLPDRDKPFERSR
jgi:hypothetical protein